MSEIGVLTTEIRSLNQSFKAFKKKQTIERWYLPFLTLIFASFVNLFFLGYVTNKEKRIEIDVKRQEEFAIMYKNRLTYFDENSDILSNVSYQRLFAVDSTKLKNGGSFRLDSMQNYKAIHDSLGIFYNDILWLPNWVSINVQDDLNEYRFKIIAIISEFDPNDRPLNSSVPNSPFKIKEKKLKSLYDESHQIYKKIQSEIKQELDF